MADGRPDWLHMVEVDHNPWADAPVTLQEIDYNPFEQPAAEQPQQFPLPSQQGGT